MLAIRGVQFLTSSILQSVCLLKGCEEEVHSDWWNLSGLKKPCGDEKKNGELNKWWDCKP
jgi:hypothetical protein